MASITNVISNYRSLNTDLSGRQQIKTPAGSLAEVMKELHLIYVPTGSVFPYAGSSAPSTFLFCDGSAIDRATYYDLFEIIGTTYGAGDGVTTFNLPNLKGKIPVCRDAAQTEFDALGETGGSKTHTLTIPEMPAHAHNGVTQNAGEHTHTINDPGHVHNYLTVTDTAGGGGLDDASGSGNNSTTTSSQTGITNQNAGIHQHVIDSQGGGQPHNNLQPYIVLNYIIKV